MAERLTAERCIPWAEFFRTNSHIKFVKFVRRTDGTVWLGSPGEPHTDLEIYAGDSRQAVVDAGSITFCCDENGITIHIHDDSGSLNKGKDAQVRLETVFLLSQMLIGLVKMIDQQSSC